MTDQWQTNPHINRTDIRENLPESGAERLARLDRQVAQMDALVAEMHAEFIEMRNTHAFMVDVMKDLMQIISIGSPSDRASRLKPLMARLKPVVTEDDDPPIETNRP